VQLQLFGPAMLVAYLTCLFVAVVSDIRNRRVSNRTNSVLVAVTVAAAAFGVSQSVGVVGALLSVVTGFACWIGFWLLGVLGAGDVKFFAAAAGWFAPSTSWRLAILSALLGGVLAFAWSVTRRGLGVSLRSLALTLRHPAQARFGARLPAAHARAFPYALPMAIVFAFCSLFPALPFLLISPR